MHTKVSFINNANQRKGIKSYHQRVIKRLIVFFAGLLVKVHYLGHLNCLMVAPEHNNLFGVFDFESHQQQSYFDSHRPAVDVVSQKQQMLFGLRLQRRTQTDDFEQVVELPVNVADDDHWLLDEQHVGFVLCVGLGVLREAMKWSTSVLTHFLGGFFSSESICLSRAMLMSFS